MSLRRKHAIRHLLCLAVLWLGHGAASAKSMVFEISHQGHTAYLAGTIHLLRQSDYPLPKEFTAAYKQSELIVLETDISNEGVSEAGATIFSMFQLPEGVTTQSLLSDDSWNALLKAGRKVGLPVELYHDKHPVFHALTLFRLKSEQNGIVAGADVHFYQLAQQDKKQLGHLETVQKQIESLSSMMEVDPNETVLSSINDLNSLDELLGSIIDSWAGGDTKTLTESLLVPMRDDTPEVYQSLLVDRNEHWLPQIKAMLATPEKELILVGSAHLLGKHGLLRRLHESGYRVKYLKL